MAKRLTSLRISDYSTAQLQQLAALFETTHSDVILLAIDRMYRQEIGGNPLKKEEPMTTETRSYINYYISTDSDSYTRDSAHEQYIPLLVERIELEAQEWMGRTYGSTIEFSTRRNGRTTYDGGTDGDQFVREVIEQLDDYINSRWTDWFEEIVETNA